jgi:hypothetical protein
MKGIRRVFLGWNRPALENAVSQLVADYRHDNELDLGNVIVVVSGRRAGRRLLELLAQTALDQSLALTPPSTNTEGELPELLYDPKKPFAGDLTQHLSWAEAIRTTPSKMRRHIVQKPPGDDELVRWLDIGKRIGELHRDLAADGFDFETVLERAKTFAAFDEHERWKSLAGVSRRYLDVLNSLGLWDRQTARLEALKRNEIQSERDIILLGAVDLNDSLRRMIDQVAGQVTAYIVAPTSHADWFDHYGCIIPIKWCAAQLPLTAENMIRVENSLEQVDAVADWLVRVAPEFRKDEVVIGAADETEVHQLQRRLAQLDLPTRWVLGQRVGESGPYRLLESAARFAAHRRYEDFAALIRHPDVEDILEPAGQHSTLRIGKIIKQCDDLYAEYIPIRVNASVLSRISDESPELSAAFRTIVELLNDAAGNRRLREWPPIFRRILTWAFADRSLHIADPLDGQLLALLRSLIDALEAAEIVPAEVDSTGVNAMDAFRILIGPLADQELPQPEDAEALEILGWLELPLDDAPALVVTSFIEGRVPTSTGADPFLPDRLRKHLGMLHNDRRFARDAYATMVLLQTRRKLCLIVPRRSSDDEPAQPSRLLFACPDDELVRRARMFFFEKKSHEASPRHSPLAMSPPREESLFTVPKPVPRSTPLDRISVTQFKHYLSCPYRYFLRYVENIKSVDDSARELDPLTFGNILHRVLAQWGNESNGLKGTDDTKRLFAALDDYLGTYLAAHFGGLALQPAVNLQIEQLRSRLRAFADRQVLLVREGWRVLYCEPVDGDRLQAPFHPADDPITLTGKIDRIDWHDGTRVLRILDYKSSEKANDPEKAHRTAGKWTDLQLPLYRHLWQQTDIKLNSVQAVELGYFNLAKNDEKTDVSIAAWDEQALNEADRIAADVIAKIRRQEFWPPSVDPKQGEEFAAICMDNVLRPPEIEDEGDAE